MSKILVSKVPNTNILTIKKSNEDDRFFLSTKDSIVISTTSLASLLTYLVRNDFIDLRTLDSIVIEEKDRRLNG